MRKIATELSIMISIIRTGVLSQALARDGSKQTFFHQAHAEDVSECRKISFREYPKQRYSAATFATNKTRGSTTITECSGARPTGNEKSRMLILERMHVKSWNDHLNHDGAILLFTCRWLAWRTSRFKTCLQDILKS